MGKINIHPSNNVFVCEECGKDDPCVLIVNSCDMPEKCIHGFINKSMEDVSSWNATFKSVYELKDILGLD